MSSRQSPMEAKAHMARVREHKKWIMWEYDRPQVPTLEARKFRITKSEILAQEKSRREYLLRAKGAEAVLWREDLVGPLVIPFRPRKAQGKSRKGRR